MEDMQGVFHKVNSDQTFVSFIHELEKIYADHGYLEIKIHIGKKRSQAQNRAMWLYLTMLSAKLNEGGWSMQKALKSSVDIDWNKDMAKKYLWTPIQKVITGHLSSTQPKRADYTKIYDHLNRLTSSKFGVSIPFPSRDE